MNNALLPLPCATEVDPAPLAGIRVLILTSGHDVGDARVYARHARGMYQLGAHVIIVGSINGSTPNDIKVLAIATPRSRWERFVVQPWRCVRRARGEQCDVVHFHDAELLAVLPIARLLWPHAVFVYDVHEDFANLLLIRDWLPQWTKPMVRIAVNLVEKGLARLAHGVVGVTPPLTLKFANRDKLTAFNYPARQFYDDCASGSCPARLREFDLVHLGTLNVRRASFLCDVLNHVSSKRQRTRVLIIGARPEIAALIRRRDSDGCVILGHTAYEHMPALLGNAKVGIDVHPWADPHLSVAVPVKVCEYMAAGCGVVCSSMPVLEDILRQTGAMSELTLLHGGTAVDYANAVLRMLTAIDSGADPGSSLQRIASQQMVWNNEAQKIANLYLTLLGRKG